MALNNTAMIAAATTLQAMLAYGQLHTASAGSLGTSNLTTASRQAVSWTIPTSAGSFGLATPVAFTGGAANGPIYSITLWSASTNGIFYGEIQLSGDKAFTSGGTFQVTALNFAGASS